MVNVCLSSGITVTGDSEKRMAPGVAEHKLQSIAKLMNRLQLYNTQTFIFMCPLRDALGQHATCKEIREGGHGDGDCDVTLIIL